MKKTCVLTSRHNFEQNVKEHLEIINVSEPSLSTYENTNTNQIEFVSDEDEVMVTGYNDVMDIDHNEDMGYRISRIG